MVWASNSSTTSKARFAFRKFPKAIGFSITQPYQLVIQNPDLNALNRYSGQLVNKLRGQSSLAASVRSAFEINKPELRISIDRDRAAALGVSVEDISRTLQMMFGGLDVSRIKLGGKEYLCDGAACARLAHDPRQSRYPLCARCGRKIDPAQQRGSLRAEGVLRFHFPLQPLAQRHHRSHPRWRANGGRHRGNGENFERRTAAGLPLRMGRRRQKTCATAATTSCLSSSWRSSSFTWCWPRNLKALSIR